MNTETIPELISKMLIALEGDVRQGTKETPARVARAFDEMFDGYDTDITTLCKTFPEEGADQLVVIRDIPFTSFCEHHMLPFQGVAHVAYLPNGRVIGASKIPRIVLAYAHRLQLQERIAEQVAKALTDHLNPMGVAVIIKATHQCMQCRGVKSIGSSMVNSVMLGEFRDNPTLRQELLSLLSITK